LPFVTWELGETLVVWERLIMNGLTATRISLLLLTLLLMLVAIAAGASGPATAAEYFFYLPLVSRPAPNVENITPPLLIDGEEGRIYAVAPVDGVRETVVLATADGHFLDSYPYAGRLALDRNHHWLLIDEGDEGLVILDSLSGQLSGAIDIPISGSQLADPQVDPSSGLAYAFRGNNAHTLDIQQQSVTESRALIVPFIHCGEPSGVASIDGSLYDPISNTLYVSFLSRACTPHFGYTIHSYDPATWHEWAERDTANRYQAAAFAGNLYGMDFDSILGTHAYWALNRSGTWYSEAGGGGLVGLAGSVVDWSRGLLYEAFWGYETGTSGAVVKKIRVSYTNDRQILAVVESDLPPILDARLAGHDPHTDMLYFLDQGALFVMPTTSVLPVGAQPAEW
jgi:hypothetical protein